MTKALEKAFVKASRLSKAAQEELAKQLLADIEGELKWDQTLATSQDFLENMANKARDGLRQRKTTKKGFDEL